MKIKEIRAVTIDLRPNPKTQPRVPKLDNVPEWVSPMKRYPDYPRSKWTAGNWKRTACVVTAEDGTWGFGLTVHSGPVSEIINEHFAELLIGENCMATEKLWDVMQRSSSPYGTAGLASFAISAVDNALWDLKGKLLNRPVYELLGGPQKDRIFCYASNTDISYGTDNSLAWFLETGFKAVKIFLRHGPEDGVEGLNRNEELVARAREQIGPDVELMVDAWLSLNIEYIVRLVEALKPYRIKWLEDYLISEDMESYFKVRQRVPGQTLATGEHWYTVHPFAFAASNGLVDIMQPDVQWVGGITASVRICHLAEAHGLTVIGHAGMNYPYGQHLAYAMPAITWGERSEGVAPPGVSLAEMMLLPGTPAIENGFVTPSDAPGFGFEFDLDWLEGLAGRG
ncbi:MAG: L-rhamnonate dehydratase [SAR202 cluster bacterium]|nr:L-rhamnonate dehydratase [Chloroflexota bacterium]MDP6419969.1 enolase C-terminal domain-like protein [SAR202 cluster bacterium]HAL49554.1 L-rhamnonate dehydratase [Dehalococcoidia bacterium]MDP6665745.1 enolase C-terminal domain-like protein [SAR202 cluster bacterium]MDP6798328.1 enolase C-terminal domain-like protein [SAR202 cluster bacterium]